ncbi:MAG: pyridoxine 5'-phosphate synthase, partial [Kiritimatiellales bacterium]|nr:pyridoxine 5'-phosphate synthase [Kiritimatiellales bacterium]
MKLGVNIDHIATLRQARGTIYPDPLEAAKICARAGAVSITVHLREDRRHIQDADVYRLSKECPLPINLEMANSEEIVKIALEVKPAEICLVPEKRKELTTEGGLDVISHFQTLEKTVKRLQDNGSEVSLFVEADEKILERS